MALTRAQYAGFCHDALVNMLQQPDILRTVLPRLIQFRKQGQNQQDAVDTLFNELGITAHSARHLMAQAQVDTTDWYDVPVLTVP